MLDIISSLRTLSMLVPPSVPVTIPTPPQLAALAPLEKEFNSHFALSEVAQALNADSSIVLDLLPTAVNELESTRADLMNIAVNLGSQAFAVAPRLLHPDPAVSSAARIQLIGLSELFMEQAMIRLEEAEMALEPATATLASVAANATGAATAAVPQHGGADSSFPTAPGDSAQQEPEIVQASLSTSTSDASLDERERGQRALSTAKQMLGTPYVWGGTSPAGFDCSGLTQYAWREAGVELPRLAEQQTVGRPVSRDELIEGDLIVWNGHVAMYAGDGMLIEAGDPVSMSPLRETNLDMAFLGYYRPS